MHGENEILRDNAEVFERLLDEFPDMIHSVDPEGRIIYVNKKGSELLGFSREELLTKNIRELYAPELISKVRSGFSKLQKRGSLSVCESVLISKNGKRIPVEIRSFALYDENGDFIRTFSILRDIRTIKELQNNLLHAGRLAAVGELAACIVHDIANPLGVIRMSCDMLTSELEEEGYCDSVPGGTATVIDRAATKIEKLVSHLRNLARTADAKPNPVDLCAVLDDALFMVQGKLGKGRITIDKSLPDTKCLVTGHATQLEQAFMNLISNAADALEDVEEATLLLHIGEGADGDGFPAWECIVRDNGAGITRKAQEHIFETFFTTKPKGKGTGLGLAIVNSIIRQHDGEITLTSAPAEGTEFRILLPQAQNGDDGKLCE
mgnify:CR=1 FL=1